LTLSTFSELGLAEPILRALDDQGFHTPTPIQHQGIPPILSGRDLLGIAQTGTGKTLAFALPILDQLSAENLRPSKRHTRALVMAPTRELAVQIEETFRKAATGLRLRSTIILGGVGRQPQVDRMARGMDIVVGTPGRIVDLMSTGDLVLDRVTHFVLDEADRMLDLGFINDIRKVIKALPKQRQSLLFSATMPNDVAGLANSLLTDPLRVEISQDGVAPRLIEQRVYFVDGAAKRGLLTSLLEDPAIERAIVFTRTKHGANRVAEHLAKSGTHAEAIHGNKSQNARQNALEMFRSGRARVLIATDIAARGIDVANISHVINFDLPNVPESYVHRIGRTARAGAGGIALSFCEPGDVSSLRGIERLTGTRLEVAGGSEPPMAANGRQADRRGPAGARSGQRRRYRPAA
jgi:ATP-dependent RNA helicase RhlE